MEDREALREAIRPPLLSDAESDEAQAGGLRAMRGGGVEGCSGRRNGGRRNGGKIDRGRGGYRGRGWYR